MLTAFSLQELLHDGTGRAKKLSMPLSRDHWLALKMLFTGPKGASRDSLKSWS